jgi:endonuclease/exonuclease/phosphatase family metal-dependent hydrolase
VLLRICAFATICLLWGCVTLTPKATAILPKHRSTIRFATYNVYWENNSKNKGNPNSIISIVDQIKPDILVLQETYCFSKGHLERYFNKTYPYRLFRQGSTNDHEDGLGLLSKYPILKQRYFPPIYGWFPGWLYVLKTPHGLVQVLNVHLNPKLVSDNNVGFMFSALWTTPINRLNEIHYYYRFLDPNEGDNGTAVNYLKNHCLTDELLSVSSQIKTWHWQYGPIYLTGRYDRILTTAPIKRVNIQVIQKGYSDHYPVALDYCVANQ